MLNKLKSIMNKKNPLEIAMLLNNNNPMINNLINMLKQGNSKGVEDFARNLFKEQGRDFDKEYQNFMNKLK